MDLTKNNIQTKVKNMTLIIELAVAAVGGFVFGVLFGRRNKKKVEAALAELQAAVAKAGIKL